MTISKEQNFGKWKNPYVEDGLEIWLDGEWNAGPGNHNPDITTWKDITGHGHDAIPTAKTIPLMSWDKKALVMTKGLDKMNNEPKFNFNVSSLKFHAKDNGSFTFECITNEMSYTTTGAEGASVIEISKFSVSWCGMRKYYDSWYAATPTSAVALCKGSNGIIHHRLVYRSDGNGNVKMISDDLQSSAKFVSKCEIGDNGSFFGNAYGDSRVSGKIFCMRFYTRALSDDELAKNYEVDKKRFGI